MSTQPGLFTPFHVGRLELQNRIVIAPMCQSSADDGRATDWHLIHLGQLALVGRRAPHHRSDGRPARDGRISSRDLGLWSDETEAALGRTLESVRRWSDMPIAIQLSHAGRKASTRVPWEGGAQIPPSEPDGWQTVAPSAIPFSDGQNPPVALDRAGLARVRDGFATAAARAARLGLDAVQLHGAHGYLLHQFLSPLSNRRDDEYGGSTSRIGCGSRSRCSTRCAPSSRPSVPSAFGSPPRIGSPGGWDLDQTIVFAKELQARGCSAVHVSSGGLTPAQQIPIGPSYQVPLARAVKAATRLPVIAVGLITAFEQAEAIVANWRCRLRRPGTGDPLRSALALARGGTPRCERPRTQAIPALPARGVSESVQDLRA